MKALIATVALISISSISFAQPVFRYLLMTFHGDYGGGESFALQNGGCLRGPLYIKNVHGKKIFELEAGIDFPTGCMEVRP